MISTYQKVSIVIPTYNQSAYLLRAVKSALMQDYPNLEVIISDDSPNTDSLTEIKSLLEDKRLKYYHNNPRLGRVLNYRKCLYSYATGIWVLNLDGDDYLIDNSFITKAIELIENNENIVFVQAGGLVINSENKILQTKLPACKGDFCVQSGWEYVKKFAKKRNFLHLTTLYNADYARKINFYRFSGLSSDLESFMRLALHGKIGILNIKAGVWFHHHQNSSNNASEEEIIENSLWINNVRSYAIDNGLVNRFFISIWYYVVKNNELSCEFIRRLQQQHKHENLKYLINILKRYPLTFFFPVFQKKLIFFLFKKK